MNYEEGCVATQGARRRRGPRGPYSKSEATQRAILDAALEVFAESGFRKGSLREVAAKVGISEAGLLHHFPSKKVLLARVLERRDEHSRTILPSESEVGEDVIRGFLDLARYNSTTPGVVELFSILAAEATSPDHPAHQYFVDRYVSARATIERAFTDLQAKGQLRPGVEPATAARAVMALLDGFQLQWLLDRSILDMEDDLRSYLQLVVTIDL